MFQPRTSLPQAARRIAQRVPHGLLPAQWRLYSLPFNLARTRITVSADHGLSMIANARTANPSATNDHAANNAEAVSSFISFVPKPVKRLSHTRDETGFLLTLGHGGSPCLCLGTSLYRSRFRGRKWRRQTIGESPRWLPVSTGYLALTSGDAVPHSVYRKYCHDPLHPGNGRHLV
jgi:hypothetical protein